MSLSLVTEGASREDIAETVRLTIVRTYVDGEQLRVTIDGDEGHPDGLLSETARVTAETFASANGVVMTAETEDGTS